MDGRNFAPTRACKTTGIFDPLAQVNAAIVQAESNEAMLSAVLDEMLGIFDCDRAWLLYPCNPSAESWSIPMERSRPGFTGAGLLGPT